MKAGNEKESAKEIFAKLTKEYDENVKKERNNLLLSFLDWFDKTHHVKELKVYRFQNLIDNFEESITTKD